MQGEYEMIISEKERSNSCKFQAKMLMAAITGLEFLNNKFDPFDVKLDGWAEQLNENMSDYDEIFAELHEKYRSKAKLAPELKLLFQLGGSAIMLHMTNTMFKSTIPGIDDIMRQNPELMQKFTQAAMSSMGTTNPGFTGFMNSVQPPRPPRSEVREVREVKIERPEMKGPSDISDLLSGLKTKTINIQQPQQQQNQNQTSQQTHNTLSVHELNDISEIKQPIKTKRKQKSDKNTVSLDI